MGSVTYNFLNESLFFNKSSLENKFKNESDSRLEKELNDYRQFCIDNYPELTNEIVGKESFLKVFSSTERTPYDLLKQTALYVDQFVIFDPLFKESDFQTDISRVTGQYLGYNQSGLSRSAIYQAAKLLKDISPMVAADYVKVFPLSYHFERPKEIPFNLPVDYYNGILPKPILEFFRENASVNSMKKGENGGWVVDENNLSPCRGIVIDFKETDFSSSLIYHLFETEIIEFNEETGRALIRQNLPETPPNEELFNAWITQSVNSAAKAYFDRVSTETFIASSLNSTYLCDNNFTNNLLKRSFQLKEDIPTYTASQVMNIDLPFLDQIDIQKLMDIRIHEEDVFTNFRLELEKNFRELRGETDEKILRQKAENIFHELNEVQSQKIKTKVEQLKKQRLTNALIGIGGFASSIHTSGFSLIATAVALGKGYKDYLEYQEQVKSNPAYLLWKAKSKKRSR